MPSGAPTGKSLAHTLWRQVASSEPHSDDLIDTATILERRYTRRAVVDSIIGVLSRLRPTGGLLGLPAFDWHAVFSTNFDRLVELAYKNATVQLTVIRSNYDFSTKEARTGACLYKIHGCITQDRSLGDKASMILSEPDYEEFSKYRQAMFSLLQTCMLTGDVLVIGQSLRDAHLADLVKTVLKFKQDGTPGQVYVLVYERDDLRAPLLEDKGAKVAFGGIDEFVHELAQGRREEGVRPGSNQADALPVNLISSAVNVAHARSTEPSVTRMFNGRSATYADIQTGATFERALIEPIIDELVAARKLAVSLIGAAGVGKTTFGRQIAVRLADLGYLAYEHRNDFAFNSQAWIAYERDLQTRGQYACLVLDECTHYLRQVNLLAEHVATQDDPRLKLILTANSALWSPRVKSPKIFSRGTVHAISKLDTPELYSLVNLVEQNRAISALVQPDFKGLSRNGQFERLRTRCSADMFVCLKNIFANDSLDRILLVEYDDLPDFAQEHYRYIAALESVGTRVHRQLIMRMLGLQADQVAPMLASLDGIVDEFPIRERDGLFGWATRHIVIARKITEYKFSSQQELETLFDRIIENINPAVPAELKSARDICDVEFGIGRLADAAVRRRLYRKLIELAPGERIPWHRLIRELLESGELEDVEYLIRDAAAAAGLDAPLDRYKVRLLVARSEQTKGISAQDRVALLRKAFDLAEANVVRHRDDRHSYRALCDVAVKLVQKGDSPYVLDGAIHKMRDAMEAILDPDMEREIRHYEDIRARLG